MDPSGIGGATLCAMPAWILNVFGRFGYLALFVGVFLENVGIPVPGETVLLAAGFLSKQHVLRLGIVIPCAIVAAILGDNLGYLIGRRGGREFAEKYGKYVALTPKRLDAVDAYFRKHGPRTIFFARFVSGIRVVAAVFAGISRIPWPKFLLYNAAGAVVWGTAMGMIGYLFGQSWYLLERWVGGAGLFIVGAIACGVLFVVLRRHRARITGAISDRLPATMTLQEVWLLLCSLVAIGLFAKIAEDVVAREATPFDTAVTAAVSRMQWPGVHLMMSVANAIGSAPAMIAVIVVAVVWRIRRHDTLGRNLLIAVAVVTQALDSILKLAFGQVRPSPLHAMTTLFSASFPSGHAMNAVAIYGFIVVLIARDRPGKGGSLGAIVAALALWIGLARVYLQLHWATDILAGYAVGLLLLVVAAFFVERQDTEVAGSSLQLERSQ